MTDPQIFNLFAEANYQPEDAYYRQRDERLLEAALDQQGLEPGVVHAVTSCLGLYVLCDAGILSVSEHGIFKKQMHTDLIPWSEIAEVVQTEPTLRVYGIDLLDRSGKRVLELKYSGGGSANDNAERNRIYGYLARGLDRASASRSRR